MNLDCANNIHFKREFRLETEPPVVVVEEARLVFAGAICNGTKSQETRPGSCVFVVVVWREINEIFLFEIG